MAEVTFKHFSAANIERSHKVWPQCDEWDERDWLDALDGEVGEARNILKKARRDGWTPYLRQAFYREVFDIIVYGFLTIAMTGGDPEVIGIEKWNEVSERNDYPGRLP